MSSFSIESPKLARCAKSDKLVLELEDLCVPIIEEAMERIMLSCELGLLIVELGVRDNVDEYEESNWPSSPAPSAVSFALKETVGTGGREAMPRPRSGEAGSSSFLDEEAVKLAWEDCRAVLGYACIIRGVDADEDASSTVARSTIKYLSSRLVGALGWEITP
jgi:hypothetical protein